jgi:hypothetical protein
MNSPLNPQNNNQPPQPGWNQPQSWDPNSQFGQFGQIPPADQFQQFDPSAVPGQFEGPPVFMTAPVRGKENWWSKIGGGSLMLSLFIHALFILVAIFLITIVINTGKKTEAEDFLPGGGGGGKSNDASKVAKRKSVSMSQPKTRIAANVSTSSVVLPEAPAISSSTPSLSAMANAGGRGGGEGGKSGKGKGSGIGNGMGMGSGPGNMAGFVAMFGKRLQAKKLGVVLDVSGSMHPYLPAVISEANKVGQGAPIVLAYGCGASDVSKGKGENSRASAMKFSGTAGDDWQQYWQTTFDGKPMKEVFDVVNNRKDTFYMEQGKAGKPHAWTGLTSKQLEGVDAVYWFADFQDTMDEDTLKDLLRQLQRRRQKLYVHASGTNTKFLSMLLEKVVIPSGGEEIKADLAKKPVAKPDAKPAAKT